MVNSFLTLRHTTLCVITTLCLLLINLAFHEKTFRFPALRQNRSSKYNVYNLTQRIFRQML